MTNKNDQFVVGLFFNEDAAKDAAHSIKEWDHNDDDVKLGAIGVITYNADRGKLHTKEIGERGTKSGAGWGTAIGAAIGILTGGIGLIPGMAVGAVAGSAVGALNHKSLGLNDEQYEALLAKLKGGGAALGIMADDFEVTPVIQQLEKTGADVSHYVVEADTAETITTVAAAQVAASKAVDAAVSDDADTSDAKATMVSVTGMTTGQAAALEEIGIETPSNLLELAATPDGRAMIAEASGLDPELVLASAKKLDLMRVKGVGIKYATLLLAAGVDTVPELATRNAANLAKKCAEVNAAESIVEELPTEAMTSDWVAQAKELPRMLFY